MKTKPNFFSKNMLRSGLALAVAIVVGWSVVAYAAAEQPVEQQGHAEQQDHAAMQLGHITTQAEAEALKPGNMIATGEKHKCDVCGGTVEVVGTGKGEGNVEELNHVCSHCGDDAMFVCATKRGSGEMKEMNKGKKK